MLYHHVLNIIAIIILTVLANSSQLFGRVLDANARETITYHHVHPALLILVHYLQYILFRTQNRLSISI
jgi:hypothetical protein